MDVTHLNFFCPNYGVLYTPSDTEVLPSRTVAIGVDRGGTAGVVKVEWHGAPDGEIDTITLALGEIYHGRFRRVRATDTTAVSIRVFTLK